MALPITFTSSTLTEHWEFAEIEISGPLDHTQKLKLGVLYKGLFPLPQTNLLNKIIYGALVNQ